jgi:Raf kinase inhibitor-like YbhB/YbcL family protein
MDSEFELYSPEFTHTGLIPKNYTSDGKNINPPLKWKGVPPGTKSFVLIVDDPDNKQGVYTIWAVKDIPKDRTYIEEGSIPGVEFTNNSQNKSYCAPKISYGTHRYFFRLYAINIEKFDVYDIHHLYKHVEMQKLGEAVLMGKYVKE